MIACGRLGRLHDHVFKYKHREVHMPRRAKVSTIEVFRYKFAEVPMPRRAKELAFWFYKKKSLYTDAVPARSPLIVE